jgi:hypothetical protein
LLSLSVFEEEDEWVAGTCLLVNHLPLLEQALAELSYLFPSAKEPSRLHEGREGRLILGERRSSSAMPSPAPTPCYTALR